MRGQNKLTKTYRFFLGIVLGVGLVGVSSPSWSEEVPYKIIIKDHQFLPQELTIPAGQKVKILVENQDASPEEFESYELNREQEIDGNNQIKVFIGPLKSGKYNYFGEYHQDTAQGVIVAE